MAEERVDTILSHICDPWSCSGREYSSYRQDLINAKRDIAAFINEENCHPIMIRLAWHDSGTFDKNVLQWPQCGGANGSIRFPAELKHGANAGLQKAVHFLETFKEKYSRVSWADLIQLASAVAVELAGGPKIPMRYGRVDVESETEAAKEGNLPGAKAPFGDGSRDAASHLRKVFQRMGFGDQEIVALSGAHTMGRAFKNRSGVVEEGYGKDSATSFTAGDKVVRADGKAGVGMAGGRSWTPNWLSFDNSYFKHLATPSAELLSLPTDQSLVQDPSFRLFYQKYSASQEAFFSDYAKAHARLSELGSRFDPPHGIVID